MKYPTTNRSKVCERFAVHRTSTEIRVYVFKQANILLPSTVNMSSTSGLHVAIYNDGGIYKHWSLFIDGPTDPEKTILHIMGSSTRYRFEMRNSNARNSTTLLELVYLCHVDNSKISAIKDAAQEITIHNEAPGYNCQDYILELLDELEEKKIIDRSNASYKRNRKKVEDKQEGLN
ncbi:hypothetical protein CBS147321_7948 [Aspergillus niger]|nr:hypothetical protein CBS12448_9985 [Aspergillus niger]KAI2899294.1 hypothetical protein CBS11852_3495 [Aspergillus niger]KAI2937233.1 hypothetical protein CBS147321_7948 [Aspergillus niger]KAI2944529.1 hypothetical protein CBS147322_8058 [Aspergillus niger]KAI2992179.1 hypothetical protein CBS147345_10336 [Aspergillus niger]